MNESDTKEVNQLKERNIPEKIPLWHLLTATRECHGFPTLGKQVKVLCQQDGGIQKLDNILSEQGIHLNSLVELCANPSVPDAEKRFLDNQQSLFGRIESEIAENISAAIHEAIKPPAKIKKNNRSFRHHLLSDPELYLKLKEVLDSFSGDHLCLLAWIIETMGSCKFDSKTLAKYMRDARKKHFPEVKIEAEPQGTATQINGQVSLSVADNPTPDADTLGKTQQKQNRARNLPKTSQTDLKEEFYI